MTCRIGITTNPDKRRAEWESQYGRKLNSKTLKTCASKAEAQRAEHLLAASQGCISHPGGEDAIGPWHVYRIDY